jgi:hypothetical protein
MVKLALVDGCAATQIQGVTDICPLNLIASCTDRTRRTSANVIVRLEIHDGVLNLQCAFLPTMKTYMSQKASG